MINKGKLLKGELIHYTDAGWYVRYYVQYPNIKGRYRSSPMHKQLRVHPDDQQMCQILCLEEPNPIVSFYEYDIEWDDEGSTGIVAIILY